MLNRPVLPWFVLAGYCLLIFIQSSLSSPDVGPDLPGRDKLVHLIAYALMGVLACRAFATLPAMRSLRRICLAGFAFAVLFGLSDEWHQSFVPGRMADMWDFAADGVGALTGAALYAWRRRGTAPGPTIPR